MPAAKGRTNPTDHHAPRWGKRVRPSARKDFNAQIIAAVREVPVGDMLPALVVAPLLTQAIVALR